MAAITPSTNLYLLKNPHNLNNENQLTFSNSNAQFTYFSNLPKLAVSDFTYQRKDYTIRYPACIDDIINYNYVMYQNENYTDKWIYAYIENMTWVNDHLTAITIKTDVYQTFMFDITFKSSFVEREHVMDDTIGLHTVPESLETGDYICNSVIDSTYDTAHPVIMVTQYCQLSSTADDRGYDMTDTNRIIDAGGTVSGVYQGCKFLLCGDDVAVRNIIASYATAGKLDAIVGLFMCPDILSNFEDPTLSSSTMWYFTSWSGGLAYGPFAYLTNTLVSEDMGVTTVSKPYTTIAGITPRNHKLFTYPYIYLMGTNNSGINTIYQYEYFNDTTSGNSGNCRFQSYGVVTPGCSIKTIPLYYKGIDSNYSEGIPLGKYPVCSYNGDVYINWLTQNSVNTKISLATSGMQVLAGGALAATGAGALAGASQITSGLVGIASTLGTIYEHSLMPPQIEGDVNSGDVNYFNGKTNFSFYRMNIKAEMVSIIDKYFDMYGYKVNIVKVPNITGRTNWNYIKCINANIEGLIPEFYLDEIKTMFNNGITLWHNPNTFLDYSQNNTIVT